MNKFFLSFRFRQLLIRQSTFVRIFTELGSFVAQYVNCSERFRIKNQCDEYTYQFCVLDQDLPSGLDICGITADILVEPFMEAILPINLEDSDTVDVQGDGTELNPYNFNVIRDPDAANDLEERANGLFVDTTGAPGADGVDGTNGDPGTDGLDGTNGTDGVDGADGAAGANGAGPAVGSIFWIPGDTAPANTLPLFGQLENRITEPELFAFAVASGMIILDGDWTGDSANVGFFSSGDGVNTFRLPDLRGYFIRGWNNDVTDPDANRVLGSVQGDAIRNITGSTLLEGTTPLTVAGAFELGAPQTSGQADITPESHFELAFNADNVVPTADENRPLNIAYMPVIQSQSIV